MVLKYQGLQTCMVTVRISQGLPCVVRLQGCKKEPGFLIMFYQESYGPIAKLTNTIKVYDLFHSNICFNY